jgi:hypothetical protein
MTLTEFLLARIAEDEAAARAVPELRDLSPYGGQESISHALNTFASEDGYPRQKYPPEIPAHYSRHDPARVLAECGAYRAIVELHVRHDWLPVGRDECAECGCADDRSVDWPCPTLRALASVYADHPDYQPEWAL